MTLQLLNLTFERHYQTLFADINCSLNQGEAIQIRGVNGSGKSTLLRILAGYIEPQEGSILWQNQCILKTRDDYQQQIHYIGHQNGTKPYLTVYENLQLMTALSQQPSADINSIIQRMGLSHLSDTQTWQLSAGQLRRTALARLLLHSAKLWILDEPATALDTEGQELFLNILSQHLQQGGMAIISTHHDLQTLLNIKTIWIGEKKDMTLKGEQYA
jgi:heme exporter protein A